jgi:hypothetical protein
LIFIPLVEFRALLIRFLAAPVRLPAALAGFRFVLVCSRHGWTPLFEIKIKRRDSAMFAMESRFWLVRYAAARASGPGLATMGRPVDQAAAGL